MADRSRDPQRRTLRIAHVAAAVVTVVAVLSLAGAGSLGGWRYLCMFAAAALVTAVESVGVRAWGNHQIHRGVAMPEPRKLRQS